MSHYDRSEKKPTKTSPVGDVAQSHDDALVMPKLADKKATSPDGADADRSAARAQLSTLVKEALNNVAKAERGDFLLVANRTRADRVEMIAAATLMCSRFSRDVSRSFTGALQRRVRDSLGAHIIARTDVEVAEVAVREALKLSESMKRFRAERPASVSVMDERMIRMQELRVKGHLDTPDR